MTTLTHINLYRKHLDLTTLHYIISTPSIPPQPQKPQNTLNFERGCLYQDLENRRTPLPTTSKFIFIYPHFKTFYNNNHKLTQYTTKITNTKQNNKMTTLTHINLYRKHLDLTTLHYIISTPPEIENPKKVEKTSKFERGCLYRGPQNRRTPLPTPPKYFFTDPVFRYNNQ